MSDLFIDAMSVGLGVICGALVAISLAILEVRDELRKMREGWEKSPE